MEQISLTVSVSVGDEPAFWELKRIEFNPAEQFWETNGRYERRCVM